MAHHYALLTALALTATRASPVDRFASNNFAFRRPVAFAPAAPLEVSNNIAVLHKTKGLSTSSKYLLRTARANSLAPLIASDGGTGYAINVAFGSSTIQMIFDTGSSDTWAAASTLSCVDYYENPIEQEECGFGPLFEGGFEGGEIEDQNINITYGDGEFLTGVLGYMDVGIGGTVIRHQEVALVDFAYWFGDNQTSGLIGLAYPSITAAFTGDNPAEDSRASQLVYEPVVATAGKQGLFTSFSMALERGEGGGRGYLALGGLPPGDYSQDFTSTPIIVTEATAAVLGTKLSYYSIKPDGFVMGKPGSRPRTYGTGFSIIVDSGTTFNYLPSSLAAAINSLFQPSAVYVASQGLFEVPCDAKAPTFAVKINGTDFFINGQDMILPEETGFDPNTGLCITGIQAAFQPPAILGDVFLRNVVAVFDVGASEMRFAAHTDY